MRLEFDEATGQISAQCPDVYLALYPAGHRVSETGKDDYYRGALSITKGSERIHLNALDIGDVLAFLHEERVGSVRSIMTKEHVATNLLRALLLERDMEVI